MRCLKAAIPGRVPQPGSVWCRNSEISSGTCTTKDCHQRPRARRRDTLWDGGRDVPHSPGTPKLEPTPLRGCIEKAPQVYMA